MWSLAYKLTTGGFYNEEKLKPVFVFIICVLGEFENIPLGTVYVRDEDDWDVSDKTFSYASDNDRQFFK